MSSNNAVRHAAASLIVLCVAGVAHADEKHLTLEDIDGLARQNLINSLSKSDGAASVPQAAGVGLSAPLSVRPPTPSAQPVAEAKPVKRPVEPARAAVPVSFVGAYSDKSGSHVLYDYQGGIYTAERGARLLNGWVVTRIDGFHVSVSEGKRSWSEVISAPIAAGAQIGDSRAARMISDLGGPLPVSGSGVVPFPLNGR